MAIAPANTRSHPNESKRKRKHKQKNGGSTTNRAAQKKRKVGDEDYMMSGALLPEEEEEVELEKNAMTSPGLRGAPDTAQEPKTSNERAPPIEVQHAEMDSDIAKQANDLPSNSSVTLPSTNESSKFEDLSLSDRTMKAIEGMGFQTMTEIQQVSGLFNWIQC